MNGANHYKQMAVKTASRGQILLMLYEAAIKNSKKAMECIDRKDLAGKGQAILKVHDIINELTTTLDFNVGGQVAKDLERLYAYIGEQLVKANINNDKEPLNVITKILENLLSGWRVAVNEYQKTQTGQPSQNGATTNLSGNKGPINP